jgi:protein involved in polysaccharide export with SLBB domain
VTGHVRRPGAYTVNSLSTIVAALLKAGGPSASGSLREIQLRRGRNVAATFDLYDLLLKGDREADRLIQADDVVHVGPVGQQVAIVGAVNKPAIFEVRAGESLKDLLAMAGGLGAVADRSRLAVERLVDRASNRVTELSLPAALAQVPASGDVYRAFSAVDSVLPVAQQNKRVRIEGEVRRPGDYVLPPASSVEDALKIAGGLTPAAYVFGTEFSRESVRISQQENYERALRDLETEFARASTQRAVDANDAVAQAARASSTQRLVERLRAVKPTGRIVLQIPPTTQQLPNLALEDGDRIYVPAKPTSIGVFGSVFNGGSYLYGQAKSIDDFLSLAGGPTRGADADSTFVLRANGSVISNLQKSSFFGYLGGIKNVPAEPGDTIFVPEEINKTTWTQNLKEWTQILYQFGLGAAALQAIRN